MVPKYVFFLYFCPKIRFPSILKFRREYFATGWCGSGVFGSGGRVALNTELFSSEGKLTMSKLKLSLVHFRDVDATVLITVIRHYLSAMASIRGQHDITRSKLDALSAAFPFQTDARKGI